MVLFEMFYLVDCFLNAGDKWNAVNLPEEIISEARVRREDARMVIDGNVYAEPGMGWNKPTQLAATASSATSI